MTLPPVLEAIPPHTLMSLSSDAQGSYSIPQIVFNQTWPFGIFYPRRKRNYLEKWYDVVGITFLWAS
jgi:acetylglutamate synthase